MDIITGAVNKLTLCSGLFQTLTVGSCELDSNNRKGSCIQCESEMEYGNGEGQR